MNHSLALLLLLAVPDPCSADELRFDAKSLLAKGVSQDLRLSADGSAVELEEGELFEDDGPAAGFSYQPNEEKLAPGIRIRKELLIANPAARKATLLVAPGGTLQAVINGKATELKREGKAGNYWETYSFPPEALKAGKNEIVLHGSGRIWIARADEFAAGSRTRPEHPNRSARSSDNGQTWDDQRLGSGGNVDGEYCIRVFLDHYRPQGSLTLPVIDAGNLAGELNLAPVASVGPVRIGVQAEAGAAGRVSVRVRSGTTPVPQEKIWSAWQDLGEAGGVVQEPRGRYLQVAVTLATKDPLQTPKLKQVVVAATPKRAEDWTKRLLVVQTSNEIVRSSIPFTYEPYDHPRLKKLREDHKLDDVVKGARGEFELITRLAAWSAKRWDQGHLKEIYPAWDALEILKPHTDGKPVGGFCQQYNLVFLQACASFGVPGRAVSIGPGDHTSLKGGGHEVVEVWSNEHKKWVYVDGNTAWYLADPVGKTPLSLWELRQRQLQTLRGKPAAVEVVKLAETKFTWKGLEAWPPFAELRLIPRSNFLEEKTPLPLNQGMRGWFWTGHHVWSDADAPASLLYGHRVSQRRNWDWTLNQAHVVLEATDKPGELRVHLDTQTPGFDRFLTQVDDQAKQAIDSGWIWKLRPGKNRLEVRPRNIAGREGIVTSVAVEYR